MLIRFHLPSFCDVKSRSDRICPVEPGRHSVARRGSNVLQRSIRRKKLGMYYTWQPEKKKIPGWFFPTLLLFNQIHLSDGWCETSALTIQHNSKNNSLRTAGVQTDMHKIPPLIKPLSVQSRDKSTSSFSSFKCSMLLIKRAIYACYFHKVGGFWKFPLLWWIISDRW